MKCPEAKRGILLASHTGNLVVSVHMLPMTVLLINRTGNNWRVPESLEKVIPVPRSLHPHLRWWLEESNVLPGQPLHPLKHALQIFTDASKEGWGAHLNECTARATWSIPESKLHINHLELKAVFLALKEFQDLCSNNKSGGEVTGLPLQQDHSDCTRVAQHALVWGSGGNVQSDPSVSAQPAQVGISTIQPDSAQEPVKLELTCLAPRATAIKEQGFSEAVAAKIEAPQRGSTRSVYEAKWTIFTKWCLSNQVDFRAPPLKAIADFLLHLFQDKKLQPGTIDGYRSAIADKLGNSTINVSKDENLTHLLDSFHRDRHKGRRGIPSWNLSLVLHQLTKLPLNL